MMLDPLDILRAGAVGPVEPSPLEQICRPSTVIEIQLSARLRRCSREFLEVFCRKPSQGTAFGQGST